MSVSYIAQITTIILTIRDSLHSAAAVSAPSNKPVSIASTWLDASEISTRMGLDKRGTTQTRFRNFDSKSGSVLIKNGTVFVKNCAVFAQNGAVYAQKLFAIHSGIIIS
jgi:hypothetical protein